MSRRSRGAAGFFALAYTGLAYALTPAHAAMHSDDRTPLADLCTHDAASALSGKMLMVVRGLFRRPDESRQRKRRQQESLAHLSDLISVRGSLWNPRHSSILRAREATSRTSPERKSRLNRDSALSPCPHLQHPVPAAGRNFPRFSLPCCARPSAAASSKSGARASQSGGPDSFVERLGLPTACWAPLTFRPGR